MPSERADGTVQLAVRIPKSLHYAMKHHAIETDTTLSSWVTQALEAHLRRVSRAKPERGTGE